MKKWVQRCRKREREREREREGDRKGVLVRQRERKNRIGTH